MHSGSTHTGPAPGDDHERIGLVAFVLLAFNFAAAAPAFDADEKPDRIVVTWDGKPVAH
jgi:hypothetical protein